MEKLQKGMDKFIATRGFLAVINKLKFTPLSKKMLFTLASRVNATKDTEFKLFEVKYCDVNKTFGTSYENISLEVDKALDALNVTIKHHDPIRNVTVRDSLVTSYDYHGESKFEIQMSKNFSEYMLQISNLMQHIHASIDFCLDVKPIEMKGYLLLKSKRVVRDDCPSNEWNVQLEDFAKMLGLTKAYYKSNTLKPKAIIPIVEMMNKRDDCDVHVEWKWLKETRTIVGINFVLTSKSPKHLKKVANDKAQKKNTKFEASTLQLWFQKELGYTESNYKALKTRVGAYMEQADYTNCEIFLEKFNWWSTVKDDLVSLRTFLTYITAIDINPLKIEQILQTIYSAERDGRARKGAMINKLKDALILRKKNVGEELEALGRNPLLFTMPKDK